MPVRRPVIGSHMRDQIRANALRAAEERREADRSGNGSRRDGAIMTVSPHDYQPIDTQDVEVEYGPPSERETPSARGRRPRPPSFETRLSDLVRPQDEEEPRDIPASPPSSPPIEEQVREETVPKETRQPELDLRLVTIADIDRLWDWARMDKGSLPLTARSSLELHLGFQSFQRHEARGEAWVRALTYSDTHIGFAMLFPILPKLGVMVGHLYIAPPVRRRGLARILAPVLVELVCRQYPSLQLAIVTPADAAAEAILPALGFHKQVVYLLPRKHEGGTR